MIIMKIKCELEHITMEHEETGQELDGVRCTCSRCGNQTESYGTSTRSVNRCLVMLNKTCPNNNGAFYYIDDTQGNI